MSETINLPNLGFNMREGTFLSWTKEIGQPVNKGESIAEVEADKATIEVAATTSGVLLQTLVNSGDTVQVGAPIAVIGAAGEQPSGSPQATPAAPELAESPAVVTAATPSVATLPATPPPAAPAPVAPTPVAAATTPPTEEELALPDGLRATPIARRIAEEKGIDLHQVRGTGPNGRIQRADIEAYIPVAVAAVPAPAAPVASTPVPSAPVQTTVALSAPVAPPPPVALPAAISNNPIPAGPDIEEIPLTRIRSRIGARMVESKQNIPHFYVTVEINMAPVMALRKQINETLTETHRVSVNDLMVKAAALTLRQFPNLNTHFYGDRLIRYKRINIGMAVAMDNGGLINVVAQDADSTPISRMAARNKEMIAGARAGKVKPEDIEGGTFTVSNLGPYDVEVFSAIINPPESAILAVASVRQVPVVVDGALQVGMRLKCTLSVDHRVSDGAEGAQFLQAMRNLIESPMRLLV